MARTYKKSAKSEPAGAKKLTPIEEALAAEEKAEKKAEENPVADKPAESKVAAAKATKASVKSSPKPASSVIAAPSDAVVGQIVYQPSSQILTREIEPNESFGVGDDMPVYYL